MGHKRQSSEEEFANLELGPALQLVSNPSKMAKFLTFAEQEAKISPVKLAARMGHFLNGSRIPTTPIALLLKKFEKEEFA